MRLGVVILPEERWPVAVRKWRTAESLGFDHVWTYDHLAWRSLRDSPWFAAIPTLTAVALATDRIRVGTLVASPNFRHPVPFARELITLDDIADGRLTVGLGSGGGGWDTTMLGFEPWSIVERIERFEEFVDLLDRLLCQPETSFHGRYYDAVEARTYPGCTQRPRIPFAIAATGPRAMRVAARHASVWVTNGDRSHTGAPLGPAEGAEVVRRQGLRFDEICAIERRDPSTVDRLVLTGARLDAGLYSPQAFNEVQEAYASVGVTDLVIHWPRESEPYAGDETVLNRIFG